MIKGNEPDWELLRQVVRDSVDFLDDVVDRSDFPLPQIEKMVKSNRKIGLGVMGWADMLYQLKIPYSSDQAVDLAGQIMEFIDFEAKQRSTELAVQKGSFPNFTGSIYDTGSFDRISLVKDWGSLRSEIKTKGMRNATLTTIAPTGTISMIADTSSGIEPQFSLVYVKTVLDGAKLHYVNKWFRQALEDEGLFSEELLDEISQHGTIASMSSIPQHLKDVFQTAHDITPEWHLRMQAAFQAYTDNAVSKTINFANNASVQDIRTAYELAYQLGCKGVTVYRDGSRENQVLSTGSGTQSSRSEHKVAPRHRPEVTHGITQRLETGCGHMYVTVNRDEFGACEVFVQMGKVGGCASAQLEAIARLSSLAMRSSIKVESIIRQLKGIRCQSPMWYKGKMITSCGDAVGQALEQYLQQNTEGEPKSISFQIESIEELQSSPAMKTITLCPDCSSSIEHLEGCLKCPSCGWSKC